MTNCAICHGTGNVRFGEWSHEYMCEGCFGDGQQTVRTYYAGIGARDTPMPVMQQMELIGSLLGARGHVLRSGGAKGADTAFQVGCEAVKGRKIIRTATGSQAAMDHAARYHPVWDTLNGSYQRLHARNSVVMLGDNLDHPVDYVVCWTNGGGAVGGTGQALRIAADIGVPVFNLWFSNAADRLWEWVATNGK